MGALLSSQEFHNVVMGDADTIMVPKAYGTCPNPPPRDLRWGVDHARAAEICCRNRHYAEFSGYFRSIPAYAQDLERDTPIEYFDSVTGKLLFTAPRGRTMDAFVKESAAHGWPSFRDDEVNWENVRILPNGECVSLDGTHLGHNLPDKLGNRYCINLVCVAGKPPSATAAVE